MSTEERTEEGIEQRTDGGFGFATGGVISGSCPLVGDSGCYWPKPNAALVLGPDDKLVVALPAGTNMAQLDKVVECLRRILGDRVVVLAGADQIASLAPEVPA